MMQRLLDIEVTEYGTIIEQFQALAPQDLPALVEADWQRVEEEHRNKRQRRELAECAPECAQDLPTDLERLSVVDPLSREAWAGREREGQEGR